MPDSAERSSQFVPIAGTFVVSGCVAPVGDRTRRLEEIPGRPGMFTYE